MLGIDRLQQAFFARDRHCSRGITVAAIVDVPTVYRCGFAGSRYAYENDTIAEADMRMFTTLARFDAVDHGHFMCNRQELTELPVLRAHARDLFQTPGFGDTTDCVQVKAHCYLVHRSIDPSGIVADGPDPSGRLTPHGHGAG